MTPDQRFERVQQTSQPLVSTLIKGSVQNQGYGENSMQPNISRPLLTHVKDGAEGKFDHQTSKVSKDSLIYSAADDERQTAHQKSTLSGTSEEQLSSHLVSDQQMFLRNPVSELALGGSQNIQIQDFSKQQDLGKLIINESVPREEALTSTFNQAGSLKKSSKRVIASEATGVTGSSDIKSTTESTQEVIRSSPVQTTRISEVAGQNRDQAYLRHEPIYQQPTSTQFLHPNQAVSNLQVQQTQLTFRSELQNQTAQNPELFVPTLPLTAGLQVHPLAATSAQSVPPMVSSTGHSTPAEHSQRTDRITTQHLAGPVKPVTSSLLAGRSTPQLNAQQHQPQQQQQTQSNPHNQHQQQQTQTAQQKPHLPPKPQSERASSSSGTQRTENPSSSANAGLVSAADNTAQNSRENNSKTAQGTPVLALRTSQSQSQVQSVQDKVISRKLAATPEVLEYVRTHQGQLPQDTVITHPPKVVAEYTLDAEGRRVAYGSQEGQMSERKIEHRPVAGQKQPLDDRSKLPESTFVDAQRIPLQSQTISQNTNQVRNFGQERVHQIDEDVIIENKPYIIDPRTKQKIYVDPNNLSAYVSLFKAQQTKAPNPQNLVGEHSNDGKPRSVLRTSNHVPKQVAVNTDPAIVRLSPQTQVVQVPKPTHTGINPQTVQRSSNSVSKVHTTAPRASPNNPSDDEEVVRAPKRSRSKKSKAYEQSSADADKQQVTEPSHGSHHKKSRRDRENVIRIPMDQAEEFLAQHRRKQAEVPRIGLFPNGRAEDAAQSDRKVRIVPGITKTTGDGEIDRGNREKNSGSRTGRDPAVIKVHAAQTADRTYEYGSSKPYVGYSEYGMNAYQTSSINAAPWQQSSVAQITGSRQFETTTTSHQQFIPMPLVVPTGPSLPPSNFSAGLGVPQVHTLPGLDMRADIDSTLQRIINRAFN